MVLPGSSSKSGRTRGSASAAGRVRDSPEDPGPSGGRGLGRGVGQRRHRKILKDTIQGITKPDIRRMARRGGVKRISAAIYDDARAAMRDRLEALLRDIVSLVDHGKGRTVSVGMVIYALKRRGTPIYGFDAGTKIDKPRRAVPRG
ncbi:MAG: Histone H4 [Watsoniomyces obsoletus]|nr:MAG: Histone H4 [Watsoniomyces obsoletus]